MESDSSGHLRALPPAHAILASAEARALGETFSREALRALVRGVLAGVRARLLAGELSGDREALIRHAVEALSHAARRSRTPGLRGVLNATGVVLHTNLGRAPMGAEVMARVAEASSGYATLEYDLDRGRRGHRDAVVLPLLQHLLGAEDALVVNNCAAAVLLGCTALAAGREVVVSRGELVEIGGGVRVPEVLSACGARLVEVGTTNRTRASDYARAITVDTGVILRVHRSNFAVVGFTEDAALKDLVALGRARGVPVLEDLGSGALVDTAALGLPREPTARESLAAGVDLVMFSGDKLLGGPQAGIIAGRRDLVEKLRRHPLTRALRPGRLVLAALEATLRVYTEGRATVALPAVAALADAPETVRARAERLLAEFTHALEGQRPRTSVVTSVVKSVVVATVVATEARVGGGALPTARLPSYGLRLAGVGAGALEAALRAGDVPVVARIEDGAVVLDVRALADGEVTAAGRAAAAAVWAVTAGGGTGAGSAVAYGGHAHTEDEADEAETSR